MYELDNAQDQIMTVCTVALTNLYVGAGPMVPGGLRPRDVATPGAFLPLPTPGHLRRGHGPRQVATVQRLTTQPRPRRRPRQGPRSAPTSP